MGNKTITYAVLASVCLSSFSFVYSFNASMRSTTPEYTSDTTIAEDTSGAISTVDTSEDTLEDTSKNTLIDKVDTADVEESLFEYRERLYREKNGLPETDTSFRCEVPTVKTFEDSLIDELNLLRENPGLYADTYIKPMISKFVPSVFDDGTTTYVGIVTYPSGKIVRTVENCSTIRQCISVLHKSSALPLLSLEVGMSSGAMDHVKDQGKTGKEGHDGSDGSRVGDRISRYGDYDVKGAGECISYGLESPRDIVISMLIDDDVPERGHRTLLMSNDYHESGVAHGWHPIYRIMCVITFASEYVGK